MMRFLILFNLLFLLTLRLNAQASSLFINGIVVNEQTGLGQAAHEVLVTSINSNLELITFTDAEGFYNIEVEDGAVIGPNQLFNVSTVDFCSGLIQIDTISNNQGTIDEIEVNFTICSSSQNGCEAGFSWFVSPNNPYRIIFEDNSSSQLEYSRVWDLGNNILYTTNVVEHTFESAGIYGVCLTITSNDCSDSYCFDIEVPGNNNGNTCNANFEFEVNSVESSVQLFPVSEFSEQSSYLWTLDGDTISDDYLIPNLPLEAGIHEICYSVELEDCYDAQCFEIIINQDTLPQGCQAYFNWNISNSNPFRVLLFDDSYVESEATYFWDLGNNAIYTTEAVEHTFEESGTYLICLTVTTNNCSDTYCTEVVVPGNNSNEDCNPFFEYTIDSITEEGIYIVSLHSVDVPPNSPVEHEWFILGYETQYGANPQFQLNQAGVYTICHSVYSPFCIDTLCATVLIGQDTSDCEAYFAASISQFDPFRVVCENQSFTNDEGATYLWDFGNEIYATTFNAEHNFEQSGPYQICLTVTSENCSDTYCETVFIPGTAPTDFAIGGQVFAGANLADIGSVRLYQYDQVSNATQLIQTTPIDTSGYYFFNEVEEGTYLIKAGLNENSEYYGSYVPTYFGSQFYWLDAEPIVVFESVFSYNISLIYSDNPGGEGWVNGNIDDGPYRLSSAIEASSASLISNADVYLMDLNGSAQQYSLTDTEGEFSFSNLAYGTYQLIADVPGMICIPVEFTLSPDNQGVTLNMIMGDEILAVQNTEGIKVSSVYPNPASERAFIKINLRSTQNIISSLTTTSGQLLWQNTQRLSEGTNVIEVPLDQAAKGFYCLSLRNANQEIIGVHKISVIR